MAIYALPTILFAFVFYNMGKPFSISSILSPLTHNTSWGDPLLLKASPFIDSICLFCLCMGMAASLGLGVVLISSGLENFSAKALVSSPTMWVICGAAIVVSFIISASVGIMRGMRLISITNSYFYFVLGLFVLIIGPTTFILSICVESFGAYLSDFFKLSLWTSTAWGDGWSRKWPTFYWCVWFAWMPVSVVFLGRISKGFTVKQTLNAVFVIPSIFSVLWIVIFSGTTIHQEMSGLGVYAAMQESGAAASTYAMLGNLPLKVITIPLFILTAALSYITSADANTNAIAGLCTKGISVSDTESPIILKVLWGITIGALCIIMLVAYDIEAVKLLSYLGGLPVMFLMILFIVSLLKVKQNPGKYDIHKQDYDYLGRLTDSIRAK
jgi:choline-glycine betaine transporter